MYMMRKIDNFLREWREDPDRKPLIVKGPRQVGKTESIRKFDAENYKSIIESARAHTPNCAYTHANMLAYAQKNGEEERDSLNHLCLLYA